VLEIVAALYDETLSEEDAALRLAQLQCTLTLTTTGDVPEPDATPFKASSAVPAITMVDQGTDAATPPMRRGGPGAAETSGSVDDEAEAAQTDLPDAGGVHTNVVLEAAEL
jgi:hypothetical protein